MSGPKIVRTVTRAERVEQARIQIAMIDEAIKRWRPEVASMDTDAAARERDFLSERSRVEEMLTMNRFDEIASRAASIVASLNQDIDRMRNEEYVHRAKLLERARSARFAAKGLLARCDESSVELRRESREILERVARGESNDTDSLNSIDANIRDAIAREQRAASSNTAQQLASALRPTENLTATAQSLLKAEKEIRDPRVLLADKQIAELERLGDREAAAASSSRLEKLLSEDPDLDRARSSLALDALSAELAEKVRLARRLAELGRMLSQERAAAEAANDFEACRQWILDAEVGINQRQPDRAEVQITKLRAAREVRVAARANIARRTAVLHGLKELGYDVKEEMSTIWAEGKKLIVSNPSQRGVALELGNSDSGRFQARMVAIQGAARDAHSDKEVEERWCGELKVLQDSLGKAGCDVSIERATPAGEHPLKVVAFEQWTEASGNINESAYQKQQKRQQIDPRRS
jgi:hypothetical protein